MTVFRFPTFAASPMMWILPEVSEASGEPIIPFCTSHSSGIGSSAEDLHDLCSDTVTWMEGRRFSGDATESDVAEWVESLELPESEVRNVGEFEDAGKLLTSGKLYEDG